MPVNRLRSDGPSYCCHGCEGAARWIAELGLERFYTRRTSPSPRPDDESPRNDVFNSEAFRARNIDEHDGGEETLTLRINGVRCAACVWLNERALKSVDGIRSATVSYGTHRARIRYEPTITDAGSIASVIQRLGYEPAEVLTPYRGASPADLTRLGVAWFCATNVMMLHVAIYLGGLSGDMVERYQRLLELGSVVLATPVAIYAAAPFYAGALRGLRARAASMDLPIAIAIIAMYAHGLASLVAGRETYLDSMTMLVAFLLAGRFVESRGRERAAEAAQAALAQVPSSAKLRKAGSVHIVDAESLSKDDVVVVSAGETVPADGVVVSGTIEVDESHMTGESVPVVRRVDEAIYAASRVVSGGADVRVTSAGRQSAAGRIAEMVHEAMDSRGAAQRSADRLAPWFVFGTLGAATISFTTWALVSDVHTALLVAIAVLVVSCPCALSLAGPAAQIAGIGAAARRGAYVRDLGALEAGAAIDSVGLDKTGTVTTGAVLLDQVDDETLALAAAVEVGSVHPIGRAIIRACVERGLDVRTAVDIVEEPGNGIHGTVDGHRISVVRGQDARVRVLRDGAEIGTITLQQAPRPKAAAVIERLQRPVSLLSGDNDVPTQDVAQTLGVASWQAKMTPEGKLQWVRDQQASGAQTVFVGDGINDAAAIAAADVGVAMSSGSVAGIRAADVVIMSESLSPLTAFLTVAEETRAALRWNAVFAVSYNIIAMLAAAVGLVTPAVAAILMPISSLTVLHRAARIERKTALRLGPTAEAPA